MAEEVFPEPFPSGDGDATLPAFPVVGIGASAGGLEAASDLLKSLPAKLGAALIIVQHLAPRHESVLPELLATSTKLPVVAVTDSLPVEPNRVYVIPPDSQLSIADGKLRLTSRPDDRSQYKPVDFFLRSLAAYAQDRAIGVVLSGTDSDGAAGIREIKGTGGITIAQEPKSAKYDGMPRSAIATGMIDLVLEPSQIADELVRIAGHPYVRQDHEADLLSGLEEHLPRIFLLLRNASGVDFTHYKLPTIRRRLQRRMVLHKLTTVDQYVRLLEKNHAEVRALHQDLLIHVTRFFRDRRAFDVLTSKVFPKIVERGGDQPIRIWVPGCSTGEEPYSIAITLLEYLADRARNLKVQIFATDVSEQAIEQARIGIFPENISADVSPDRLARFFNKTDGKYRINKAVRDMCIFARQDLTRDPPFSNLDLVVCRNVLIYLGPVLQRKVMNVFHYALHAGGFLLLGQSESAAGHSDLFAAADKRDRLYSRRVSTARADVDFPAVEPAERGQPTRRSAQQILEPSNVQNESDQIILARYAPPGVIVDSEMRIVQFRGQTGMFLEPAPGEASLNLLKMTREGLLFGIRAALTEARKSNIAVRKEGLRLKHNGHTLEVDVVVAPLNVGGRGRHFLVLFEQKKLTTPTPEDAKEPKSVTSRRQQMKRLQEELAASREYLQSIIQDLEAANEELQSTNEEALSANEELQSTNEELDTAKEELQSTNEELNTVNEELHARNEELSRVNSDLINLLGSVHIAIVMVSGDLRIRRFTPMAEKVLNLISTDVGRPISDIKPNIDCPELEQLITRVIESVSTLEREVRDRTGKQFLLRIRPYKNLENRIDGAVLALLDMAHGFSNDKTAAAV